MRRTSLGRDRDLRRKLEQPLHEVALGRVQRIVARREVGGERLRHALLALLAQDARDPRVRVLDVVDGILLALLAGEREVQVERRVVASLQHVEARGVDADVFDQVVERDDLALPLRHLGALPPLDEVDELHDQDLERIGIASERTPRRVHPRHVSVVVGAPEVDQPVVAALALVEVVGDVGAEVRPLPVRAPQDAVLVVAELARAKPQGSLVLVHVPALAQQLQGAVDLALARQHVLVEEAVEADPEALERGPDVLDHQLDAALGQLRRVRVGGARQACREVDHVLAAVAVLGRLLAPGARGDRLAELQDLRALVVHVELALDVVARGLEDPAERVAPRRVPPRGDRYRAGRVGAHELDQVPSARRGSAATVVARSGRLAERATEPGVRQEEVEEARARHLDALERRPEGLGDTLADALRHRARLLAHHRGEQHRRVAREVAEVGSGRALQLGAGDRRAAELGGGRPHGLLEGADRIGRPAVGGRLRARGGHAP